MLREVPFTNFSKGVVATAEKYAQPKGSIRKCSNLLFTRRGSLTTRDGDSTIASLGGTGPGTGQGRIVGLSEYTPVGGQTQVLFLQNDSSQHIAAPNGLTYESQAAGGTFAGGTYYWVVTAVDGDTGETVASNEISVAVTANNKVSIAWNVSTNAVGYNIYRGTSAGAEKFVARVTSASYVDTGTATTTQAVPTSNTTAQLILVQVPGGKTSYAKPDNILGYFSSSPSLANPTPIGGYGGSGQVLWPTYGIAVGATSPSSRIIQFAGSAIVALGNGYAPQLFTQGSSLAALANNFVVAYPAWTATTAFLVGDLIQPATPNGYGYKCIQQGTSASSGPTFPTGLNSTVQDGTVIWLNVGSTSVVAPRGAEDAIVHEGALWLWNTSSTNTTDGLDGPCALKMSNVRDPNSWNPINTAFVDKDDGESGTAMASFTIAEFGIAPTGSLVLFKEHKTYQVTGIFGATDFSIQRAKTEMGCVAKGSIFFISGIGLVRMTHLGLAAFDGVNDNLISEEIRPYLFGGVSDITAMDWNYAHLCTACGNANPPGYCIAIPTVGSNGALSRILFFDVVLKAWTVIDLKFNVSALHQIIVGGTIPITAVGGFSDGALRRIQAADSNSAVTWSFDTPEIYEAGGSKNTYVRRLLIRGTATGGTFSSVSLNTEGSSIPCNIRQVPMPYSTSDFELEATIHRRGTNFRATISGTGGVEIDSIVWHVEGAKVGSLASTK